jgi:glutathione synthase/RimK-type ligase-like ATP-grasp enzyme
MIHPKGYIKDRRFVEYVKTAAQQLGIEVDTFSDNWIIRMRKDGKVRFATGYRFDVNNDAAAGIAQDKVATYELLTAAEIPAVKHILFRYDLKDDSSLTEASTQKLHTLQKELPYPWVIKPLNGQGATGVNLITKDADLLNELATYTDWAIAVCPLIHASAEYRIIILDGEVLLSFKKIANPKSVIKTGAHELPLFNLAFEAKAEEVTKGEFFEQLKELALKATSELQLRLACVDIFDTADGLKVIEMNDSLMLEHFSRSSEARAKKAKEIYFNVVQGLFK